MIAKWVIRRLRRSGRRVPQQRSLAQGGEIHRAGTETGNAQLIDKHSKVRLHCLAAMQSGLQHARGLTDQVRTQANRLGHFNTVANADEPS